MKAYVILQKSTNRPLSLSSEKIDTGRAIITHWTLDFVYDEGHITLLTNKNDAEFICNSPFDIPGLNSIDSPEHSFHGDLYYKEVEF